MGISTSDVYKPSNNIVTRKIGGEIIIVPITSGIGDMKDDLYCLNSTGKKIWDNLNGKDDLLHIVKELSEEYDAPFSEIEEDVLGIIEELSIRNLIDKVSD